MARILVKMETCYRIGAGPGRDGGLVGTLFLFLLIQAAAARTGIERDRMLGSLVVVEIQPWRGVTDRHSRRASVWYLLYRPTLTPKSNSGKRHTIFFDAKGLLKLPVGRSYAKTAPKMLALTTTNPQANSEAGKSFFSKKIVRSTGETARQKAGSVKCTGKTARQKRKKGALAASRARTPREHAGKLPMLRPKHNGKIKK
ncbi:hypothetical protein GGTG_10809 [Gaeumannomyces tritici R3-111a-1]|uniref:Uncharacterized protein n=1 Tax=Gaeumannomyces tritici (strain R3-111a-1) TaxID=644352 RepID=J3PBD6_GAET3|nr:hypothetical protein GGTG_10809 [Gaeumannomyces tritici R3-111a-1]EJT71552.1 hypothetical protein GGTG_10809 [Gaeumannomyces tritici R3-111a-1]